MWLIAGDVLAAPVERFMQQGIFDLIGTAVPCGKVIAPAGATSKDGRRHLLNSLIKRYD